MAKEEISSFQISPFMLAIRMMLFPSACQASRDKKAKVAKEGHPGLAGVILAEEVGVMLCPDTVGVSKGGFTRVVSTDNACSDSGPARKSKPNPASQTGRVRPGS